MATLVYRKTGEGGVVVGSEYSRCRGCSFRLFLLKSKLPGDVLGVKTVRSCRGREYSWQSGPSMLPDATRRESDLLHKWMHFCTAKIVMRYRLDDEPL
jgi:hypothetical protein